MSTFLKIEGLGSMKRSAVFVFVFFMGWAFYFFSSYSAYRTISMFYYSYKNGDEILAEGACLRVVSPWVIKTRPHEGYDYYDIIMADLNRETILLVAYDPRSEVADSVLDQVDALYFQYKGRHQDMLISDDLSALFDSQIRGYFIGSDRRAIQEFSLYLAEQKLLPGECKGSR